MYELIIANKNYSSWSLRPWVLMRQLEINFTEVMESFEAATNFDKFRRFSPAGTVPCLRDGDTVVWDSLAISEYLAESHPQVWPADRHARAWARCVAAEMHSGFSALRNICPMNCAIRVEMFEISAALEKDLQRIDEIFSEGLQRYGGRFLTGDSFTAVDAFFCPVAYRVQSYGLPLSSTAAAYCERLLALPVMRQWDKEAISESWREVAHEAEAAQAGRITEDRR